MTDMRKDQEFLRTRFNDDKISSFSYSIWLTVEIRWHLWRNVILLTLRLVNLWIFGPNSFDSSFGSEMSTFLVNMVGELGSQVHILCHVMAEELPGGCLGSQIY